MKRRKRLAALALALCLCLCVPAYAAGGGFPDVPPDSWYAGAVDCCVEQGLMNGTGGLFQPEAPMSRAMLAQVLYRAAGSPAPQGAGGFGDVPEEVWYAQAAQWALEIRLMIGDGHGRFQGEDPVTREQFAAVLWRYAGSVQASGMGGFSDGAEISPYARAAVAWAAASGVVTGFPDGRFAPQAHVTRAQAAAMFQRCPGLSAKGVTLLALGDGPVGPDGIAQAEDGSLYISDTHRGAIRRVTPDGGVTTFASGLSDPMGLCWSGGALGAGAHPRPRLPDGAAGRGEDPVHLRQL